MTTTDFYCSIPVCILMQQTYEPNKLAFLVLQQGELSITEASEVPLFEANLSVHVSSAIEGIYRHYSMGATS